MKRIICILLSLLLMFSLCACGDEEKETEENTMSTSFSKITLGLLDETKYVNDNSVKIWSLKQAECKDYDFDYKIKLDDTEIIMPESSASDLRKANWDSKILDTEIPEEIPFEIYLKHKNSNEMLKIFVLKKSSGKTLIKDCKVVSVAFSVSKNFDFETNGITKESNLKDIINKFGNPSFIKPDYKEEIIIFKFENSSDYKKSLSFEYDIKTDLIKSVAYTYDR